MIRLIFSLVFLGIFGYILIEKIRDIRRKRIDRKKANAIANLWIRQAIGVCKYWSKGRMKK